MQLNSIKWLLAGVCVLFVSCAIITVNVYFPEKAVKEAYKSLDDALLKNGPGEVPPAGKQPVVEPGEDSTPQSRLFNGLPVFSLAAVAHAAENYADELTTELGSMPEVLKAYEDINKRLPRKRLVDQIFQTGYAGMKSQLLV